MSDAVAADLWRQERKLDADERFDRAVESRAEDAYSDPMAVMQTVAWFADSVTLPADKHTNKLIGEVLVYAMTWARAIHEAPAAGILDGAAAKLVAAARALDMDGAFCDRMHLNAAEWVEADAQDRAEYDADCRADR